MVKIKTILLPIIAILLAALTLPTQKVDVIGRCGTSIKLAAGGWRLAQDHCQPSFFRGVALMVNVETAVSTTFWVITTDMIASEARGYLPRELGSLASS